MKSSRLIWISIFLTAVILVVIGGVTSNALAAKNAAPTPAPQAVLNYQAREAQYNQLIQQANDQLAQANTQLQELQSQVNQLKQAPTQPAPAADTAISPDKAAEIGKQAAGPGETLQKTPDLVDFQGKAAYEVVFDKGSVYVDAQTGEVIFNGTLPQQINADKAAQLASSYLGNKPVLKVDEVTINNVALYRVAFRDGTLAWVDKTGQITDIQLPQVVVHQTNGSSSQRSAGSTPAPSTGNNGGGGGSPTYHDDDQHDSHESD